VSRFRILGLDWFEVVVQVGLTIALGTVIDSLVHGPDEDAMIAALVGGSLFLLAVRRKRALARMPDAPAEVERVEDLEARIGELEQMQFRVAELEERLDFAERLLGQQREPERLPRG
jgi:hypothetical protein